MHKSVIIKSREKESKLSNVYGNENVSKLDLKVYSLLIQKGPLTRSQMAKMTGIARSTLYDSLLRLSLKSMAKKYSDAGHSTRGRPKVFFEAIK